MAALYEEIMVPHQLCLESVSGSKQMLTIVRLLVQITRLLFRRIFTKND